MATAKSQRGHTRDSEGKRPKLTANDYPETLPFREKERTDLQVIPASMPMTCRSKAAGTKAEVRPEGPATPEGRHSGSKTTAEPSVTPPLPGTPHMGSGCVSGAAGDCERGGSPEKALPSRPPPEEGPESIRETQRVTRRGHCQRRGMCSPSRSLSRGMAPLGRQVLQSGAESLGAEPCTATRACLPTSPTSLGAWGATPC